MGGRKGDPGPEWVVGNPRLRVDLSLGLDSGTGHGPSTVPVSFGEGSDSGGVPGTFGPSGEGGVPRQDRSYGFRPWVTISFSLPDVRHL